MYSCVCVGVVYQWLFLGKDALGFELFRLAQPLVQEARLEHVVDGRRWAIGHAECHVGRKAHLVSTEAIAARAAYFDLLLDVVQGSGRSKSM